MFRYVTYTYVPPNLWSTYLNTLNKFSVQDLWNTGRKIQIQTKIDQPSRNNGQHQTSETRPQI